MPYPSERWSRDPLPEADSNSSYEEEVRPRPRKRSDEAAEAAAQDKAFRELSDEELRGGGSSVQLDAVRYGSLRTRDMKSVDEKTLSSLSVEDATAARAAKNAAIIKEISENATSLRTEPTTHESGMIRAHVEKFKKLPPGPEKEKARASAHAIVQGTHRRGSQTTSQYVLPYGQEMPCATPHCQNMIKYDTNPGVQGAKAPEGSKEVAGTGGRVKVDSTGKRYGTWGSVPSNEGGGDITCPDGKCNIAQTPNVQRPRE